VKLNHQPHELSEELETLMKQMEASCDRSQAVFSRLSGNQLNFRPANGTHTPRWNAEHMMGRQLLFFSQIYHALDPTIPVMDLNPKQMPPDYVPAHPDWDGKEEARQMQRVSDFTRRFAYLLRGINLDVRAPGSRWTLRGLLRQMDRHYDDHTANTKKKFELAGWPDE
ncbi:DinB family protein, partial [Stieleria sp.]|uniref:DinB family protein n=1 Tax=Stieleria sp. TaxID=2795976 RepID=UPI00356582A8